MNPISKKVKYLILFSLICIIIAIISLSILKQAPVIPIITNDDIKDNDKLISIDDAKESVIKFIDNKSGVISFSRNESLAENDYYIFMVANDEYYVNMKTGVVECAIFQVEAENDVNITESQAKDIGSKYLASKYPNLSGTNLTLVNIRLNDLEQRKEYSLEWRETIEGVETPNYAYITISPGTGTIISYQGIYRPIVVDLKPCISREKAEEIAIGNLTKINAKIIDTHLLIKYIQQHGCWSQKLVWKVIVYGEPTSDDKVPSTFISHGGEALIDAQTGKLYASNYYR